MLDILNIGFEIAARYIFYFSGDIDRFIGDTFVAVFNDLTQAIKAIYGMQKELHERNEGKAAKEMIEFRIGMHLGKVLRGNIGASYRYDYALIGDTVAQASRLESKSPHGGFVISQTVYERLELDIPQEYRKSAELKGHKGWEDYYSMYDYLSKNSDKIPKLLEDIEIAKNAKNV